MNYIDKMHRYGRIWAVITCSVIMAFPFVLAICFSAWPDLGEFFNSLYPIALTFWPVGIIEVITYTPMLGVGGTYLGRPSRDLTNFVCVLFGNDFGNDFTANKNYNRQDDRRNCRSDHVSTVYIGK